MKNDKEYTEGIVVKDNKFLKWLDNFWYHYKWHTIATAFIIVVLGVCLVNCVNNSKTDDVIFTYAGPKEFVTDPKEKGDIEIALDNVSKTVYGEDADIEIVLNSFLIYSEEQIKAIESENFISETEKLKVDTAFNTKEAQRLDEYLQTGESYILMLDPSIYNNFIEENGNTERLVPLSDIYGESPVGANDKFSVRLGDTEIYKNTEALRALPEDTVLCFHHRLLLSVMTQEEYDKQMRIFKDLASLAPSEKSSEQ